jgi:hypothetical protein
MKTTTGLTILLLVVALLGAAPALAAWFGPLRALTPTEWLALFAGESDAVIEARVVRLGPVVATSVPRVRVLTLAPVRWLKGREVPGEVDLVLSVESTERSTADVILALAAKDSLRGGIFFLRHGPLLRESGARPSADSAHACALHPDLAEQPAIGWYLVLYPAVLPEGPFLRLDPAPAPPDPKPIEATVARQGLDSLLARADLVVIGHPMAANALQDRRCDDVAVDRELLGRAPSTRIDACTPDPKLYFYPRADSLVLFLRKVGGLEFEYLDFGGGAASVVDGRVARFDVTLDELAARAAAVARARGIAAPVPEPGKKGRKGKDGR